jgi:hypothetical protein
VQLNTCLYKYDRECLSARLLARIERGYSIDFITKPYTYSTRTGPGPYSGAAVLLQVCINNSGLRFNPCRAAWDRPGTTSCTVTRMMLSCRGPMLNADDREHWQHASTRTSAGAAGGEATLANGPTRDRSIRKKGVASEHYSNAGLARVSYWKPITQRTKGDDPHLLNRASIF